MNYRRKRKADVEPALTPEQVQFATDLLNLESIYKAAKEAYWDKKNSCKHVTAFNPDEDGSAWCALCGADLGWYCPDSPDHSCYYFTNPDGKIHLHSGVVMDVPDPDHDPDYETSDCCLFCGAPEERK